MVGTAAGELNFCMSNASEPLPKRQLIGCPARETPSELRSSAGHRRPIPPDLLRQASHRLQIMALVGAGLWTFGVGLGHLAFHSIAPQDPRWARINITDLIAVG